MKNCFVISLFKLLITEDGGRGNAYILKQQMWIDLLAIEFSLRLEIKIPQLTRYNYRGFFYYARYQGACLGELAERQRWAKC